MLDSLIPALVGAGVALLVAFVGLTSERARENAPRKRVDAIRAAREALEGASGARERRALIEHLHAEVAALERTHRRREPERAVTRRSFYCIVVIAVSLFIAFHIPGAQSENGPEVGSLDFYLDYGFFSTAGIAFMLLIVLGAGYAYNTVTKTIRALGRRWDERRKGEKFFAPGWDDLPEDDWTKG